MGSVFLQGDELKALLGRGEADCLEHITYPLMDNPHIKDKGLNAVQGTLSLFGGMASSFAAIDKAKADEAALAIASVKANATEGSAGIRSEGDTAMAIAVDESGDKTIVTILRAKDLPKADGFLGKSGRCYHSIQLYAAIHFMMHSCSKLYDNHHGHIISSTVSFLTDPFCIVKWNGREVGRTSVVQASQRSLILSFTSQYRIAAHPF